MLNAIRADIYRIVRGKTLYITFALLIILALLEVLPASSGANIGINTDVINMNFSQQSGTGAVSARQLLTVMDNLIYFLIPMFITVAMSIFSCGAVKNSLSAGMSRVKLYFSKWILCSILCVLLMLVYIILGVLATTVVRGFGDWTGAYFLSILQAFGAQMVLLLAFSSVGVFLSFTVRNSTAVTGIYIAFALVPAMVVGILGDTYAFFTKYYNYDMTMCMKLFSYIENMKNTEIIRGLVIGMGYILVSTIAGIAIFRKAEIK